MQNVLLSDVRVVVGSAFIRKESSVCVFRCLVLHYPVNELLTSPLSSK